MVKRRFTSEQATAAIGKTAKLLAKESVEVTTRGARAFIEWYPSGEIKRINLPMVPRDASSEFLDALQGFLDHEVAHALFTEPVKGRALEKQFIEDTGIDPQIMRSMANIVEDVRIEVQMESQFRGSRRNLQSVREFFVNTMTKPALDEIPDGVEHDGMRRAYILPVYFRARGGQTPCIHFMDDNDLWPYVKDYDTLFPDMSDRLRALTSTEDSVRLAIEVIELTCETTPPESDEADPKESDEADPKESDDSGDEQKNENGEKTNDDESGEQPKTESTSDDGGDDESDEGDTGESNSDSDGDNDSDGKSSKDDNPSGSSSDKLDDEATSGGSKVILTDVDYGKIKDFDEAAADILEIMVGEMYTDDAYHVYSRDYDKIFTPKTRSLDVSGFEDRVEKTTSVLRKELQRLIAARSLSHMVPGKRSGKIHSSSLHRLGVGDARIFARKHETVTRDTAISLVVDCSGSMRGSKIKIAMEAAWAFSATLTGLKVSNEVLGFTTAHPHWGRQPGDKFFTDSEIEKYAKTLGKNDRSIRKMPLRIPVFKSYDEPFGIEQKRRMVRYGNSEDGLTVENVDGESIRIAAERLFRQRADRRVMIVFSDGSPSCQPTIHAGLNKDLNVAVKEITDAGIELIGIGIQDQSVLNYYPKSFVIDKSEDLAGTTLRELKAILTK